MNLFNINKEIEQYRKYRAETEVKIENIKPIEVTGKTYTDVDEMIEELGRHTGWTILDYLESYWHRYFWNFVSDIPLRVKTFVQRGIRGWADSDTWCLDSYLSTVISEGIDHLIKNGNTCFKKSDINALKEIIKTFKTADRIIGHRLIYTPSKKFSWSTYKKQKRLCEFMNKKYKVKEEYRAMTLREVIKFEKGFDTFKDKFFYLWD
jgi:hypothetical protein